MDDNLFKTYRFTSNNVELIELVLETIREYQSNNVDNHTRITLIAESVYPPATKEKE